MSNIINLLGQQIAPAKFSTRREQSSDYFNHEAAVVADPSVMRWTVFTGEARGSCSDSHYEERKASSECKKFAHERRKRRLAAAHKRAETCSKRSVHVYLGAVDNAVARLYPHQ